MAKIRNPALFTDSFEIDLQQFENTESFNPTLNVDTKLFIDPLLLDDSSHKVISKSSTKRLKKYFGNLITLLKASTIEGDLAWREADRRMAFHEISGTCLGYGAASINGSAIGKKLRGRILKTAKQIITLGVEDPKLFLLLPLLEEDFGPDRISDMITRIIFPDLAKFTLKISKKFSIETKEFEIDNEKYFLPKNPLEKQDTPVVLVPQDILSKLPVATDWSEVANAAHKNRVIRNQINDQIGRIWKAKNRKDKKNLRNQVLSSKQAFSTLLSALTTQPILSYDFKSDPSGLLSWRQLLKSISDDYPFELTQKGKLDIASASDIVIKIIEQFSFLVEHRGLSKILWKDKKNVHHERVSQMVFFAVADSYCKANDLDITPEADTGNGAVDFKFSKGYKNRILVEIKLSRNPNVLSGYEKQLAIYAKAEKTMKANYLVIDIGRMGKKYESLLKIKNRTKTEGKPASEIYVVDGNLKLSASKRK